MITVIKPGVCQDDKTYRADCPWCKCVFTAQHSDFTTNDQPNDRDFCVKCPMPKCIGRVSISNCQEVMPMSSLEPTRKA